MKDLQFNVLKIGYLVSHYVDYALVPRWLHRMRRSRILNSLTAEEKLMIQERVDYYCNIDRTQPVADGMTVEAYRFPYKQKRRFTTYFFDLYDVLKYMRKDGRFRFIPGDVTQVPTEPTFVKSRPVGGNNGNAVLLKLNKLRHFTLVNHDKPFREKKDMLVGRTAWANASPQRRLLYQQFWNHPLCEVGKTKVEENEDLLWTVKPFLSREQQLDYKFIACIEGVDVATNLKWVMSSNSVAVSPSMKYETWFMEGRLIPNYHYIEVKTDFSDLIEKLEYYIAHPEEAEVIVRHAHEWVDQFTDKRIERATQIAVAQKYFTFTNP